MKVRHEINQRDMAQGAIPCVSAARKPCPSLFTEADRMTIDLQSKRGWAHRRNHGGLRDLQVDDRKVFSAYSVVFSILAAFLLIFCASMVQADEIPEDVAVRVLIGEAGNQGELGMIAVAEVLRRRGSVKGFYGLKAKHVDTQPAWVWTLARKAWRASASTNYTAGATHFENVKAFGTPYWAKSMQVVYRHKDHTFYKKAI